MITGTDKTSIEIIDLLNCGKSSKEIIDTFNISISNFKKLSMFNNLLTIGKENLSPFAYIKLKSLGLKACVLSKLFKKNDFITLELILNRIDENITRDNLSKMPSIIIEEINCKNSIINLIETIEKEKISLEKNLYYQNKNMEVINKITKKLLIDLNKCSITARDFLLDVLGINNERIVLYKKLYQSWHNYLKNKCLYFDKTNFVWVVTDIKYLINSTENRVLKNKQLYFDPSKVSDYELNINPYADVDEYKNAISISPKNDNNIEFSSKIISDLEKKIKDADIRIGSLKVQLENYRILNHTLPTESDHFQKNSCSILTKSIMEYFLLMGYIACNSVQISSRRNIDVAAYNENDVVFIKILNKDSELNFKNVSKSYLSYSNKIYIATDSDFYYLNMDKIDAISKQSNIGILIFKEKTKEILIIRESSFFIPSICKSVTMSLISSNLCKKYISFL